MTHFRVAVIGGTGPQGKGLAYRFARHGHDVVLGSRTPSRAEDVADTIRARMREPNSARIAGTDNVTACGEADLVVLAVPYDGHDELVAQLPLSGKVVISCVNPLAFDKMGPYGRLINQGEGSAAESAQSIAPEAVVVGAFHSVSATRLWGDVEYLDEDVLVVGDDPEAKAAVMELTSSLTGRLGVDAGRLRLARQLEPFTAVLISINRRYKDHAGVRVTGIPALAPPPS